MRLNVTAEDNEMAVAFIEKANLPLAQKAMLARFIAELRMEIARQHAGICEDYAKITTYALKAAGARECGTRILKAVE